MKLWRIGEPYPGDDSFAAAIRRGAWTSSEDGVCPVCMASRQRRTKPLIIEWEPGSERVGDFLWPGVSENVAVASRVLEDLQSRFSGFEAGPVEMVEEAEAGGQKRVSLPYGGPPLAELWVTHWAHI
jgi:hypothetical protein